MEAPTASANDYLANTRSVLDAATRLRSNLGESAEIREYAIAQLEEAVAGQDAGGTRFRSYMFDETAATTRGAAPARAAENTLVSIQADLEVANVLIAAGVSVGETGEQVSPDVLDNALRQLQTTTESLEKPVQAGTRRYGFVEEPVTRAVPRSASLDASLKQFEKQVDTTLAELVAEAKSVVTSIVEALSKVSPEKVLEALSRYGKGMEDLPKVGRLVRRGIEKLKSTIDALFRFVGIDALEKAKAKVEKLWNDVVAGKHVEDLLKTAFGIEATRKHVERNLKEGKPKLESLDKGTESLAKLSAGFKDSMGTARGIVGTASAAGAFLAIVPVVGQHVVIVALAIDLIVLGWVLLAGADNADYGSVFQRTKGVRLISDEVGKA